ncbi:hypothetical protein [Streptomyces sp. UNOC14_S4]|uniref:hypothetical protein n=1 Tax=Streptomyces sp. UNOC14_S4 TaxID=2872340 RepID=UPI001E64B338|nr:hypothetical protein [Streptomyces sp. UNOC14_S4]MCC3767683.1 hypothetical protein [Streptomyces sp. UNOC14_S4]
MRHHPAGTPTADASTASNPDLQGLTAILRLITNGEDANTLLRRLATLHVDYTEAARRLNIPEKWLRERISSLPHRKMGKFVGFADEDLRAISEMYAVRPDLNAKPIATGQISTAATLTPSRRSRSRSRS